MWYTPHLGPKRSLDTGPGVTQEESGSKLFLLCLLVDLGPREGRVKGLEVSGSQAQLLRPQAGRGSWGHRAGGAGAAVQREESCSAWGWVCITEGQNFIWGRVCCRQAWRGGALLVSGDFRCECSYFYSCDSPPFQTAVPLSGG